MNKIKKFLHNFLLSILRIDSIRKYYSYIRYLSMRENMKILDEYSKSVGKDTISHNISALKNVAAFGMGNRMGLLLYPLAMLVREIENPKVLIVGPRTEDDLFWAKSLGMTNVHGLDLFSYSPMIDVGDIHNTSYANNEFDAVLLGWMISYCGDPKVIVAECKRILKPGGFLGFGIESNPAQRITGQFSPPRANSLNSASCIADIVKSQIVFVHDPMLDSSTDNAVIFKLKNT